MLELQPQYQGTLLQHVFKYDHRIWMDVWVVN